MDRINKIVPWFQNNRCIEKVARSHTWRKVSSWSEPTKSRPIPQSTSESLHVGDNTMAYHTNARRLPCALGPILKFRLAVNKPDRYHVEPIVSKPQYINHEQEL